MKNVAGSGARWIDVSAERFPGWIEGFCVRHGAAVAVEPIDPATALGAVVTFTAPDGAVAECHPPYAESFVLPVTDTGPADTGPADTGPADTGPADTGPADTGPADTGPADTGPADTGPADTGPAATGPAATGPGAAAAAIAAHAAAPRTVGVLLVRLGGYAAGVFTGYPPVLRDAKAGSRPVHGRSAAGGWSQHRFARRREKQASEALDAAANAAVRVFGAAAFDAFVLGGDKRAVAELREDARLARYFALATGRFLTVPDPRRAVLEATPKQFTAVRIRITDPDS